MKNYRLETKGISLKGIITCGARAGYSGEKEFSLEEALVFLEDINKARDAHGQVIPSCMIIESTLLGRAGNHEYREQVYKVELSWSPRSGQLGSDEFCEILFQYADQLGLKAQQERMYIEFEETTYVFKRSKK